MTSHPFPLASVIVPAHNEGSSIEACLSALLDGAADGEFDIIVVCNACSDDTASRARSLGRAVRVLETPTASKTRAMNLGDAAARTFPRVYLDADIVLRAAQLRDVIAPLLAGDVEATAPGVRFELDGAPWTVRAFHEVWRQLPQVGEGLGGRGVYALSEPGHARFGTFPDIIGDDLFIDWLIPEGHRRIVEVETVLSAEPSLHALLHRKARIAAGRMELLERGMHPRSSSGARGLATAVRRRPGIVCKVPVFVLVTLEARRRARRRLATGAPPTWEPVR